MRIIYGAMSYKDACYFAKLMPLEKRRRQTANNFFIKMQDSKNILHHLLPPLQRTSLRHTKPRQSICTHTDRFKNSFIPYALNHFNRACQTHCRYSLPQQCLIIYRLSVCIHVNVYSQSVCVLVCARPVCAS